MTEHLGYHVRCNVTGFEGIADQYIELLGGTVQYSIQPPGPGGSFPEAYSFDVQQVERRVGYNLDGPPVKATPPSHTDIALGDRVEDIITGTTGIVTRKATFLNGCVYFTVTEHRNTTVRKDGDPTTLFVQHDRLIIIEKDSVARIRAARMPAKPAPEPDNPKVGGPTTRSMRI